MGWGGGRERENEYKLSLEVIVDCLWECCDSKSRGQEGQGDSQRVQSGSANGPGWPINDSCSVSGLAGLAMTCYLGKAW